MKEPTKEMLEKLDEDTRGFLDTMEKSGKFAAEDMDMVRHMYESLGEPTAREYRMATALIKRLAITLTVC